MCKTPTILILFLITLTTRGQKLNHELSKLLFDVDVTSLDTTLIGSFGKIPSLEKRNRIDTFIIHRQIEHSSYFYTHSFEFRNNRYIKTPFKFGLVNVVKIDTSGNNSPKTRIDVWLAFNSKKDIETVFKNLVRTFSPLGVSSKRKPSKSNTTEELTVINEKENRRFYLLKSNPTFNNVTDLHLTLTISSLY